jgi:hypothetical protein
VRSITIVLHDKGDQTGITVIRNETPPRMAASVCQLAATQLLEEAIRAEMEAEASVPSATTPPIAMGSKQENTK